MPQKPSRLRAVVIPGAGLLMVLLAWEATTKFWHVSRVILPTPVEVLAAFVSQWPLLLKHTAITMAEALAGFAAASVLAYAAAVAFVCWPPVRDAVYPYAVAIKSTPLIAIAPLLVLWFGNGLLSKVVMSALVAFFPVLVNSVDGLGAVDGEVLDLMRSLSASDSQILRTIRIPTSLPSFFSGLKIASSLAVVGAVIGEFTGSTRGIGYVINTSSYYLNTDLVFAAVATISLGGIGLFFFVSWLGRRVAFWAPAA